MISCTCGGVLKGRSMKFVEPPLHLHRLEIGPLSRAGFLDGAHTEQLVIHDAAGRAVTLTLRAGDGEVIAEMIPVDHPAAVMRESIIVSYTSCNFGGRRAWWICPQCSSRRGALFEHQQHWRCRDCLGLSYHSQRVSRAERLANKIKGLREQLGPSPFDAGLPERPKGMRRCRYFRTLLKWREARRKWFQMERERLENEIAYLAQHRTR